MRRRRVILLCLFALPLAAAEDGVQALGWAVGLLAAALVASARWSPRPRRARGVVHYE